MKEHFEMETGEYNMNTLGNNSAENSKMSDHNPVVPDSTSAAVLKHNDSFND